MQAPPLGEPVGPGVELHRASVPRGAGLGQRRVVIVGHSTVGKTTLFNRLTGEYAPVANYPGVTVEQRVGTLGFDDGSPSCVVVDGPGTCSLHARSTDEQLTLSGILGLGAELEPDLVLAVVDSGQLVRGLYLVLELRELGIPVVVALNMIDEVRKNPPRAEAVTAWLRVPCVATSGRTGQGVAELRRCIARALDTPAAPLPELAYPAELERDIERVKEALPSCWRTTRQRERALALWALGRLDCEDERGRIDRGVVERCRAVEEQAHGREDHSGQIQSVGF